MLTSVFLKYFKANWENSEYILYINQKENAVLVEERYNRNISVIKNIFVKRETKRRKSNVYIHNDSPRVVSTWKGSRKD